MAHNKEDIIMKRAMAVFAGQALAYFGETKKVREIAQTELTVLEIKEMRMDYVFLMDDDTYTHFEFQTTDKGTMDLVRFNLYDVRLYQETRRQVYTYVVYSGDIKNPLEGYNNGFSQYKVKVICMADKDAEKILNDIESKLIAGQRLTDKELLDLTFTPIMGGTLTKENKLVRALKISKDYPIDKKQDIQAMLYTFALKFLKGDQLGQVKEVIMMTELGRMLREDGIKEGMEKGIKQGREEGIEKAKSDMVKELLKERLLTKEQISKTSKLPIEKINEIEKELATLK